MLLRALRPFTSHPDVTHVVAVVPAAYEREPPEWLATLAGEGLVLAAGGATRADSVRSGLRALRPEATIVLVHDAARPFVSRDTVDAVIVLARRGVGAVAALAVTDTVKQVGRDHQIARTVPRDGLWRAQTPQGFPRAMLEEAYGRLAAGDTAPTDEAELCERCGFPVEVVPDGALNFKVTTPEDFRIAEALVRESR
jgi:2-C-methyl-D-erythritol 4-phosphate cytidylyltransferase